jgi:branched-chain amino acid transport system permease protein
VALPFLVSGYFLYIATVVAIFSLVALGLNVLTGYAGQISLGHAGFFCVGAYAAAFLTNRGLSLALALLVAGLVAALTSFLMGFPAVRLSGLHLAIATLAFGVVVERVLYTLQPISGGGAGLRVQYPSLGPWRIDTPSEQYFVVLAVLVLMTVVAVRFLGQKTGRAFLAIRESELAAASLGIRPVPYKLLAFVISAFYTGVAGALYAYLIRYLSVQTFDLRLSISFLIMIIIGGLGSVTGSFLGAIFVIAVPEVLRGLKDYQVIVYGAAALLTVIFWPGGMVGIIDRVRRPRPG